MISTGCSFRLVDSFSKGRCKSPVEQNIELSKMITDRCPDCLPPAVAKKLQICSKQHSGSELFFRFLVFTLIPGEKQLYRLLAYHICHVLAVNRYESL
jgi:hypothetical protein